MSHAAKSGSPRERHVDPVELGAFYASCEGDDRRNAPHESTDTVDAGEDERYGEEVRGEALPPEPQQREKRLAAIERAKVRLEATQRTADDACGRQARIAFPEQGRMYTRAYVEHEPRAQSNIPDLESRIMNTSTEEFGTRKTTERRTRDSVT